MNILNFIKGKKGKSLVSTFHGITDESLKANIISYEEQLKKSNELKDFKSFIESIGIFKKSASEQVCILYEHQIVSAESVLKDIITDLYNVYNKDVNDKDRIRIIKSFENLLSYYRDNLFFYENVLKLEWNNYLKGRQSEKLKTDKKAFNIKDLFFKNKKQK